jgi:predicted ester cyclase
VRTAFPDLRTTVEYMIAEGVTATVRWSGTGTQGGMFTGMPLSGQRARVKAISWLRFKNGRMGEEWSELSGLGMPQQMAAPAR